MPPARGFHISRKGAERAIRIFLCFSGYIPFDPFTELAEAAELQEYLRIPMLPL